MAKTDPLTRTASRTSQSLLLHMKENYNFLTLSEANTYQKEVRELRDLGYIRFGHCESGIYQGAEGYVVLPKRKAPEKKDFQVVAVAPGGSKNALNRGKRPKKVIEFIGNNEAV